MPCCTPPRHQRSELDKRIEGVPQTVQRQTSVVIGALVLGALLLEVLLAGEGVPDEPRVGDKVQEVVFAGVDEEAGAVRGRRRVCHQRVPGGDGDMSKGCVAGKTTHSMTALITVWRRGERSSRKLVEVLVALSHTVCFLH